ncbi:hypothetical protein SAMN04488020_10679 [Palleronia marisminoris]|uniref:Uncharacterized protein n=1 Tax=Palleronia marisminoris TaxID=315423 RepID=A0A1Y5SXH3_9RHOB|nr:hypothetical protein [Palleronia marisminoris]SFH05794.1 hypothetical protein SAMN04488020_10679 [Palleronia marisminoris]SLN50915.1 hypothetical protein PAM7066_02312 [Palleronia marisminoris]
MARVVNHTSLALRIRGAVDRCGWRVRLFGITTNVSEEDHFTRATEPPVRADSLASSGSGVRSLCVFMALGAGA